MKKAVIFDIDGVLAKISTSEDGTPKRGYRDYDKVDLDEPVKEMFRLLALFDFYEKHKILFVTGRKEMCRKETETFIYSFSGNDIFCKNFNEKFTAKGSKLFMRPDNDHRPAVKLKKEIYETQIKGKYNVFMAFDDDPEVCKMYKGQGILTMQVMSRD